LSDLQSEYRRRSGFSEIFGVLVGGAQGREQQVHFSGV
jgi:hypothetical protein